MYKLKIKDNEYLMSLVEKLDPEVVSDKDLMHTREFWESLLFFEGLDDEEQREYLKPYEDELSKKSNEQN